MRGKAIDFAAYVFIRVMIALVQALPLDACEKCAEVLATFFTRVVPIRRRVIDENLQTAFPSLTADERHCLSWQMWRHLFLMMAEIAQTPRKVHETNWKEHSHIVNQELFVRTLLSGRPLVLISAHYGNFELGGYLMGLFGFPTYTVARALDNQYLDRWVNDFRGRTGQYMLPKKGSGADIQRILERGGILTLLGD
jgi:KDO2-lipid IV(A) lauroyltransferase